MCNNVANCNIKAAEMRWHNFYLQLRTSHPTNFSLFYYPNKRLVHLMAFTIFMTLPMRRVVYLVMYWIFKRGEIKWRRAGKKFMHRKWQKFRSFMSTRARLCLCGFTELSSTSLSPLLSHEQKLSQLCHYNPMEARNSFATTTTSRVLTANSSQYHLSILSVLSSFPSPFFAILSYFIFRLSGSIARSLQIQLAKMTESWRCIASAHNTST